MGAPLPGQLRCGAHADSGTLTIVWEDGPGLEVKPAGSEDWLEVGLGLPPIITSQYCSFTLY